MPRLVWFVLKDGRSVVAGCGTASKAAFDTAIASPDATLTLTSDDAVEELPSRDIRDFVMFDARSTVPAASAIYRLVHI